MQRRRLSMLAAWLLAGMVALAGAVPAGAQSNAASGSVSGPMPAAAMPKVGDIAPDFTLRYFDGTTLKQISLSQYRGKSNVVVAFFIFAFTGG